jgi:hypothetical protein
MFMKKSHNRSQTILKGALLVVIGIVAMFIIPGTVGFIIGLILIAIGLLMVSGMAGMAASLPW